MLEKRSVVRSRTGVTLWVIRAMVN